MKRFAAIVCLLLLSVGGGAPAGRKDPPFAEGQPGGIDHMASALKAGEFTDALQKAKYRLTHNSGKYSILPDPKMPVLPAVGWRLYNDECNTDVKPLRSGHEPKLYKQLKQFIAEQKGRKLSQLQMMKMAMSACSSEDGKVDMCDVLLTLHNVTRFLARPNWASDPETLKGLDSAMRPIADDILGIRSIDTLDPLPVIMKQPVVAGKDGVFRVKFNNLDYTKMLFQLGEKGIFEALPGTRDNPDDPGGSICNGGAWYYYWLGAFAQLAYPNVGDIGVDLAMLAERYGKGKGNLEVYNRTLMQLTHFGAGRHMAQYMIGFFGFYDKARMWDDVANFFGYGPKVIQMKRKTQSTYCTNNPNVDSPIDLPPDMRKKNLMLIPRERIVEKARELLDRWRKMGMDTSDLEKLNDWFMRQEPDLKIMGETEDDRLAKEGARWGFWLRTLARRDPARMAENINIWMDRSKNLPADIRTTGNRAIRAIRLFDSSKKEVPLPRG
ncbi:MAG: hypothetical protein AAB215_09690 [Planctomycetota bacterium]